MKVKQMRYILKSLCFTALLAVLFIPVCAQEEMQSWHHQTSTSEFPTGIGSAAWYSNSTQPKARKIVVAILDSGIDIEHPDLKENIWINPGEISGNNKDDDGNGFVD